MHCQHGGQEFEAKTVRHRFCSAACQAGAWQASRKQELGLVEESLARTLDRVRRLGRRVTG